MTRKRDSRSIAADARVAELVAKGTLDDAEQCELLRITANQRRAERKRMSRTA